MPFESTQFINSSTFTMHVLVYTPLTFPMKFLKSNSISTCLFSLLIFTYLHTYTYGSAVVDTILHLNYID